MELYNNLNYNLQTKIINKLKKKYVKNEILPLIESKYKEKIKKNMFSLYYRIFDECDYLYYLAILETDILYYFNDFECFRSSMNTTTQEFLSKCFKKPIKNYKQYLDTTVVIFKKELVLKLINSFTVNQFDDFYNKSFIINSVSF